MSKSRNHDHDHEDPLEMDFSGDARSRKYTNQQSQLAVYGDIDLASGFPSHLIWSTKDKRRIAIPNLQDSHLLNIIAYLRRRSENYRKMVIKSIAKDVIRTAVINNLFTSDIDLDDFTFYQDVEIQRLKAEGHRVFNLTGEQILREFIPQYSYLLQEVYRRKLLIEVDSSKLQSP